MADLGLVAVGGAIGTACRQALLLLVPPAGGIPIAILVTNLVGAFLLGMLIEALVRGGPDAGRRRALRLLLGTGVLGGFTTYSALAVDTALLLGTGAAGVLYGVGTVVVGAAATGLGILLASAIGRRRTRGRDA